MQDLPEELIRVNAILREYTLIHDAIFKFSWRKTLPIPGIFKATDFGTHYKELDRLASKLSAIAAKLKLHPGSLEGSHEYTAALLDAVQFLRKICRRLHEKSQGDISKYPMAEYNTDLKTYEGLMNTCQELGVALNQNLRGGNTQSEDST